MLVLAVLTTIPRPLPAAPVATSRAAPPILRLTQRRDRTVVSLIQPTARPVVLPPDDGIYPNSLGQTRIVAARRGGFVIFTTDYASRPNGGRHQCGAGTETMLRVVALRPALHQTFALRTASCWRTIDEGEIGWDDKAGQLAVERTTYDPETQHQRVRYRVSNDGNVTILDSTPLQ
ncbi:hypothetical protein KZX46_11050 [Polymorphobacter sp. PAMC 29334]|uniref:hypothetical protein n=1 Tax=Polymorphobacter sp. PAMC 29334 TaxID=2862331 RepID=UPI001C767503|nr:hypothetical protein [Polymorphobacter sp. PAMC 29334]QYE36405.1 hypothetical protein KZX46_11050 [Polymorphobacter sp. PAMC 29334]